MNFAQTKNSRSTVNQAGFTVMELLVASVVTGMLIIGFMNFLTNTLVSNTIRDARSDQLRESQLALDALTKDIRLSSGVDEANRWIDNNSPITGGTAGYGWASGSNALILATAAEDSSNNILFQDATHYITHKNNNIYYVSGGTLYKRTIAASVASNSARTSCPAAVATAICPADRALVKNVSDFTIHYYSADDTEVTPANARSVEVSLTLNTEKYGRTVNTSYSTRTVFRNE